MKVIHPNETPYKVMQNFSKKAKKFTRMGTRKLKKKKFDTSWEDYLMPKGF